MTCEIIGWVLGPLFVLAGPVSALTLWWRRRV